MGEALALRLAQESARKAAIPVAKAEAAIVAERVVDGRLPADVARYLRANPPAPGKPGSAGQPGLVWRGPWKRTVLYAVGDATESDGSSYVSTRENKGEPPPTSSWDLLAKRGEPGYGGPGPMGPPGPSGTGGGAVASVNGHVGVVTTPLADVLGADPSAEDIPITNAGGMSGRDGSAGNPGSQIVLGGGNGDEGNDPGAQITFQGGDGLGDAGKLQIRTAGVTGNPGDRLTVDPDGNDIWAPLPVVVSPTDPGATGRGSLWLRSATYMTTGSGTAYAIYIRNDTNTAWLATTTAVFIDDILRGLVLNPDQGDTYEIVTFDVDGQTRNDISIGDAATELIHLRADGTRGSEVVIGHAQATDDEADIALVSYDTDGSTPLAQLTVRGSGLDFAGPAVFENASLTAGSLPTSDPATPGALWVDTAADFVVKVSQG